MSFARDVTDMRRAAEVFERVNATSIARLLRDIARAAEQAGVGPISSGEQARWTPVVAHAAGFSRDTLDAAPHVYPEQFGDTVDLDTLDLDSRIADLADDIERAAVRNRNAGGAQ